MFKKEQAFVVLLIAILGYALIYPWLQEVKDPNIKSKTSNTQPDQQLPIIEVPLHNVLLPDFSNISDVKEKKRQFFSFLRPSVLEENERIKKIRSQIILIKEKLSNRKALSAAESELITSLSKRYKIQKKLSPVQKAEELLNRLDIVPAELVLVQAANESAWGTSRFARIGLNFFGIWCFKKGCGMVPNGRDKGLKHEVAAFSSVENAVKHYLFNINTNRAYTVFRNIRAQLREQNQPLSGQILATGLLSYSERGTDYILEISEMIRHNQTYFDSSLSE